MVDVGQEVTFARNWIVRGGKLLCVGDRFTLPGTPSLRGRILEVIALRDCDRELDAVVVSTT